MTSLERIVVYVGLATSIGGGFTAHFTAKEQASNERNTIVINLASVQTSIDSLRDECLMRDTMLRWADELEDENPKLDVPWPRRMRDPE